MVAERLRHETAWATAPRVPHPMRGPVRGGIRPRDRLGQTAIRLRRGQVVSHEGADKLRQRLMRCKPQRQRAVRHEASWPAAHDVLNHRIGDDLHQAPCLGARHALGSKAENLGWTLMVMIFSWGICIAAWVVTAWFNPLITDNRPRRMLATAEVDSQI